MNLDIAPQQVELVNKMNLEIGGHQLLQHCCKLYNLDDTAYIPCIRPEKSFWSESGKDPLEYIYVFRNAGDGVDVPRHWHYVGFGLSDIRGYSMFRQEHERLRASNPAYEKATQNYTLPELYPPQTGVEKMNGFGFELTIRIKCNSDEEWDLSEPPHWPQRILQDLARYVFRSRNTFSVGDHVAWHSPLDSESGDGDSSRIEHILMTLDPQLEKTDTTLGPVKFIQIVGVCKEELQAAREWNVSGILKKMKKEPETGGRMLVTDMRRGESIFDLKPELRQELCRKIEEIGSDMAQISNKHKSSYTKPDWFTKVEALEAGILIDSDDMREEHEFRIEVHDPQENEYPVRTPSRMSLGSESALKIENAELQEVRYHDHIYILLSQESARILPVMLQGRLKHKKPFSFQSFKGDSLITFIPEGSSIPSLVSFEMPIAKQANWLQIFVSNRLLEEMYEADFNTNSDRLPQLPKNYSWQILDHDRQAHSLHLTIVDEINDI